MESDMTAEAPSGYIQVRLRMGKRVQDLWQVIEQGAVVGYLDSMGAAFAVPEVYEMTVLDPELRARPF